MTNRVVLDTSVLVALVDARDKWHSAATAIKDVLKAGSVGLIYLDPVINETISVLARRLQEQRRGEQFEALARLTRKPGASRAHQLGVGHDTATILAGDGPGA